MARQEIASTFRDGLMMDLNPINTPKSVLTDCLNGTYITYNGNEFVLQNDMGNYKLKNCKLPTNFIPVGVKGYGDILYIVSYNPITKETEIGSYPAPQSIFTTGETEDALEASPDQLTPFAWGPRTEIQETEVEYPDIIKTNKKPIFIFNGPDEETYKLNPGDEFKFTGSVDIPTFIYQHLNFYIIDEDNKLYDIDDTQIYNESGGLVSDDLRKVFWETPGWLAAQYDLYVPDRFNLNLRSLNVPEFLTAQSDDKASSQTEDTPLDELEPDEGYFKVSMDLSSQTIITDKLFRTELDKKFGNTKDNLNTNMFWEKNPANVYDHLYIRYLIKRNIDPPDVGEDDYGTFKGIVVSLDDGKTKDYTNGVITKEKDYVYYDIPVWKHNYQDDIITAYNNVRPIWFCENPGALPNSEDLDIANYHGVVELTAYPIIKYKDLTLKYTQFSTTQRFPLNTLKNSSGITIADSIYKWSVDDDSCTISFNINGPFINASDITGEYSILKVNSSDFFNSTTNYDISKFQNWEPIPNLVLYGQNTININFNNNWNFSKEGGVYILCVKLYQNSSDLYNKKMILVPSQVFNDWFGSLDSYENLTTPQWVGKWLDNFEIANFNINSLNMQLKDECCSSILIEDILSYKWSTDTGDFKPFDVNAKVNEFDEDAWTEWLYTILKDHFKEIEWIEEVPCKLKNTTSDKLLIKFDPTNLVKGLRYNGVYIQETPIKGDLWTPEYTSKYDLYSNISNTTYTLEKDEDKDIYKIDISNLAQIIEIGFTGTEHSGVTVNRKVYPFRSGYLNSSGTAIDGDKLKGLSLKAWGRNASDYSTKGAWQLWYGLDDKLKSIEQESYNSDQMSFTNFDLIRKYMEEKNVNMFLSFVYCEGDNIRWCCAEGVANTTDYPGRMWNEGRTGILFKTGYQMPGVSSTPAYFFYSNSKNPNSLGSNDALRLFNTLWNMYYKEYTDSGTTYIQSLTLSETIQMLIQEVINRYNINIELKSLEYFNIDSNINTWYAQGIYNKWSESEIDNPDILGMKIINQSTSSLSNTKSYPNNILSSNTYLTIDLQDRNIGIYTLSTNLSSMITSYNDKTAKFIKNNETIDNSWGCDTNKDTNENLRINNKRYVQMVIEANREDEGKLRFDEEATGEEFFKTIKNMVGDSIYSIGNLSEDNVFFNPTDSPYILLCGRKRPGKDSLRSNSFRIATCFTNMKS